MITRVRRDDLLIAIAVALLALAIPLGVASCDKVPLLAPTGTVITLLSPNDTAPPNSSIDIIATAIENGQAPSTGTGTGAGTTTGRSGAGTPVQNGTVISFTTTIGRIEPQEARTHNGQVTVKLMTGAQSGTATVTAFSGGATSNTVQVKIGSAAADHVLVSAAPQTLSPSGGTSTITARVENVSGAGVPGVPVTFTTDAGSLAPPTATTDDSGVATTTLTTSQKATVTANVAGKTANVVVNLNPRTGITLAAPTTPVSAGQPATFTVGVGTTANIRDVIVDWGDGTTDDLGGLSASTTISHTYVAEGTFTVRATATDATGFSESVATSVIVLPGQPPTVTITAPQTASVNSQVQVSATVSGATSTIVRYEWTFGPDAIPTSVTTSSRSTTVLWRTTGTKTFSVRVVQASGPEGDQVASITIVQ
jgi:hypothetical protein